MEFRLLKAGEIDCRIAQIDKSWCTLLLYKDARVDQNILDETVGCMNWQRHHTRDNANCIVAIWDEEKKQWVEKEDTGTESFSQEEKGLLVIASNVLVSTGVLAENYILHQVSLYYHAKIWVRFTNQKKNQQSFL
jgi:hypothetical protein